MFRLYRLPRPDLAELRGVVDDLPLPVRIAMLTGVRRERIIAGGYADGRGGVCPMLAAHRHGARWSHPDFARTWDEFAEAPVEGHRDVKAEHVGALADALRASIEGDLRAGDAESAGPTASAGPRGLPVPPARPVRVPPTGTAWADTVDGAAAEGASLPRSGVLR